MIKSIKKIKHLLILISVLLFLGFCIITNNTGDYRYYIPSDLPFVYRLHSSTPSEYFPIVWEAASEWNKVEGSYFVFQEGPTTPDGNLGLNSENLVFFDLQGQNFPAGTNIIAFSSTFTTSSGGFRAVESDYIYNARDFPPGLNGEPGLQDLHSISVHELGHHLGLDHTGLPGGASSGCGPLVQNAVMWAFSSGGDTTKRRLHVEDVVGLISIYPNWVIQGKVTDYTNGLPLTGSGVTLNGTFGSEIGPVINPIGNRRNKVGLINNQFLTDENGDYKSVVKDRIFSIQVDNFGYYGQSQDVTFNPPSGIGNTQFLDFNFNLQRTPIVDLNVSIFDSVNNIPIVAFYELFWMGNLDSALVTSQANINGTFTESISSAEYYRLVLKFNHPYMEQKVVDSLFIPETGLTFEFKTKPVSNLLVLDLENPVDQEKHLLVLRETNYEFAVWDNIQSDSSLSLEYLENFPSPLTLIWATSSLTESGLTETERTLIKNHLINSGRLILSGQNISEFLQGDSLIENYIGVKFSLNYSGFSVRGFSDDLIGDGISFTFAGGSKDQLILSETSISTVTKSFHYGSATDTSRIAGIRFENDTYLYKGFFIGFGFEFIPHSSSVLILTRVLNYTNDTSNITSLTTEDIVKPLDYTLSQNYPNPFNPSTKIAFSIPVREKVELKVFNSLGEEVATLINREFDAGRHEIEFNASSLASGIYFYRIKTKSFSDTKKFVLLK